MRQALKHVFYGALHAAGLTGFALRKSRRHVPVLIYHGVAARRWPAVLDCEGKHLPTADFDRQLAFLKDNFQVVTLARYAAALSGGEPLPEGCAVITFDDGYEDNHESAFPLLRKYGLPATVFLSADFVIDKAPLWVDRLAWAFARTELGRWKAPSEGPAWPLETDAGKAACYLWAKRGLKALPDADREFFLCRICAALAGPEPAPLPELYRPLSRDQVREMAASGLVEFGSHGCRHAILTSLPQEDARRELVRSKEALEEFCGAPVRSFSYPNGDWTPGLARMAAEAGYSCAVAGGLRLNPPTGADPFAIARLALAAGDSPAMMAATLSGIRARVIGLARGAP